MTWRRPVYGLHRDVGFTTLGLVLVYGISGVAVNHREHWNFNQSRAVTELPVGRPADLLVESAAARRAALAADPSTVTSEEEPALVASVSRALGRSALPRRAFWRDPNRLSLFFGAGERDTVDYHPSSGTCTTTVVSDRPLLRQLNFLHLNEGKALWTYIADLFAVSLMFLALSGVILVRGKHGLRGRGGLFALGGALLPLVAWIVLHR